VSASGGDQELAASPSPAIEPVALGAQLRRLRHRAGLTREQLAEYAGVSVPTILALELGRRHQPHPHTLEALAAALGLAAADRAALLASAAEDHPEPRPAAVTGSPVAPARRLPLPLTPLVGRVAEVAQVCALLDPAHAPGRLLVLVGPGGVGKTRLALAAAGALVDAYPDGVVFVDLAPVRNDRLVAATIARALDVREGGGRGAHELLVEHLREQRLLLVLDNFEHLQGARPGQTPGGRPAATVPASGSACHQPRCLAPAG
jgi:transcriptional regulator with XRE-family HTH domain